MSKIVRFLAILLKYLHVKIHNLIHFNKLLIYVSGPMSNKPNKNHELFCFVTDQLRKKGYRVINPAENDFMSTHRSWAWYMKLDISNLVKCDAFVLLPGWEDSKGAVIETAIAERMEIPLYNAEEFLRGDYLEIKPIVEVKSYLKRTKKKCKV